MCKSGIYKIENIVTGKVYIGQSCNIDERLKSHRRSLLRGSHDNQRLQRAWNKYGESYFVFDVVEIVAANDNLTQKEQYWIDTLRAAGPGGYNMCPAAGSCLGRKLSKEQRERRKGRTPWNKGMRGQYRNGPASDERKKKISEAQKGEKNHNYGKKTPDFVKEKIRSSYSGSRCYLAKLNEQQVAEIKIALKNGEVGAELARKYGVANAQISAIKTGKTWKHVNV